ncbi:TcpQ domain-containing protein (plasmid) [Xenorhabdus stockiae]|uniref:TcpQ domain-containing protein n=1 Tax=Xenorhabdus stockiae TaxID=351614 RepID=UPI003CEA47A6
MKKSICIALTPVVLSGCAIKPETPSITSAQKFVTTLIQDQLPIIKQAHTELAQVSSTPLKPNISQPNKNTIHAPDRVLALKSQPDTKLLAIRHIGKQPDLLMPAIAGNGQSLYKSITQIIPVQWQQTYKNTLKPEAHRSLKWKGNAQWPHVLNQIMLQEGLIATIDWSNQRVLIANKTSNFESLSDKTSPTLPILTTTKQTTSGIEKAATGSALSHSRDHKKVWRIEAGNTLKDILFNWSASEKCTTPGINNWTVVWMTSINYRIDAPLQFEGSYHDALNKLFTLYGSAKVPLYAGIRNEQCVLSIDDKEVH